MPVVTRAAPERLTLTQARRVALAAQGFTDRAHALPSMRTLQRTLERTGVLQVDSVNVLQRAHYMPLYSRMGPYDIGLLHRASERRPRRMVEYWAHVQAFMPVELWPVMRHRMEHYRSQRGKWGILVDEPELEANLLAEVRDRGTSTARDLDDGLPRSKEHWGWNWSSTRRVLDFLYMTGELAIAGRNSQFEILYDLPERVLPSAVLAMPTPDKADADRELVRRAARSHGVATVAHLRDYYRMSVASTKAAVDSLIEAGELVPVTVAGWRQPAYLHAEARLPRRVRTRALLSPFDPVVWERDRAEALFDFFYRIEIYTPPEKRIHGYYVLPFLLDDRIVARVDLKADRASARLLVRGSYAESHAPAETAEELAAELWVLAGWLGLDDVVVEPRGDLAPRLTVAVHHAG